MPPIVKTVKTKKFSIEINQSWCKGCYLCLEVCPIDGIFIKEDRIGEKGFSLVSVNNMEKCTGCMLCELLCPDLAIIVNSK